MQASAPSGYVPPNYRTARLFGIFNVLFAAQLLVCGLFMWGYIISLPFISSAMSTLQKQAVEQAKTTRRQLVADLNKQREEAKTEAEKAEIDEKIKAIEDRANPSIPAMFDMNKMGLDDPRLAAWGWVDGVSGVVLNVLLLASGIGLMHWRPWSRRLAIWTAACKIVRLVLLQGYAIVVIIPMISRKFADFAAETMAQQRPMPGGGPPPTQLLYTIYVTMYSVMALGVIVFGVIYPALLLWYMNRPGVKMACSGQVKLPAEPKQPC